MSIDTKLYLPPETRYRDFVEVLTILLGGSVEKYSIKGSDHLFTKVTPKLEVRVHDDVPGMISFDGIVNDNYVSYMTYHFESQSGERVVINGFSHARQPVWYGLCDFFGGRVDLNDCDDTYVDYSVSQGDLPYRLDAEGDEAWDQLQVAKLKLKPRIGRGEWNAS